MKSLIALEIALYIMACGYCHAEEKHITSKIADPVAVKCYPEKITAEDKKLGAKIPCAPVNFIPTPLAGTMKTLLRDPDNIWTDNEMWSPRGSTISKYELSIGDAAVTVSMAVTAMCSPRECDMKVRIRRPGRADVIKKTENMVCSSPNYLFLRNDLQAVMACDHVYALK